MDNKTIRVAIKPPNSNVELHVQDVSDATEAYQFILEHTDESSARQVLCPDVLDRLLNEGPVVWEIHDDSGRWVEIERIPTLADDGETVTFG